MDVLAVGKQDYSPSYNEDGDKENRELAAASCGGDNANC